MSALEKSKAFLRQSNLVALGLLFTGLISTAAFAFWALFLLRDAGDSIPLAVIGFALTLGPPVLAILGEPMGRLLSAALAGLALPLFAAGLLADGVHALQSIGCIFCCLHLYIYLLDPTVRQHCLSHRELAQLARLRRS